MNKAKKIIHFELIAKISDQMNSYRNAVILNFYFITNNVTFGKKKTHWAYTVYIFKEASVSHTLKVSSRRLLCFVLRSA